MTWQTRFSGSRAGSRCSTARVSGSLMLLILAAAMVVLPSCDLFGDSEPDVVVSSSQSWSGRNWSVQLDGAEWDGCKLGAQLTITNTGSVIANFGHSDEEDVGYLYVVNTYNDTFEPYKLWPWEKQFYEEKFYPGESRSGTVEYEIDPRSEQIRMLMFPPFGEVQALLFDLGSVPDSCE